MTDTPPAYDPTVLEAMNEKAIRNQLFTPDRVYLELGLFKDIPIGAVYLDHCVLTPDETAFIAAQAHILQVLPEYQIRTYEAIDPYLAPIGMTTPKLQAILADPTYHDQLFALAPASAFFYTLIQHTIRNQNHSRPAEKFIKKPLNQKQYTLEPIPVTYRINTYPLQLSPGFLGKLAPELGEAYGVNIEFMCKDPARFDAADWEAWMKDINAFYIDSFGRFQRSQFIVDKQGEMQFVGYYLFVRKRFEDAVRPQIELHNDFETQIQWTSARMGIFCDFEWLQNTQLRLTDDFAPTPFEDEDAAEPAPS